MTIAQTALDGTRIPHKSGTITVPAKGADGPSDAVEITVRGKEYPVPIGAG